MDRKKLRRLLRDLKRGDITIDGLLTQLQFLPYENTGFASIDHHRSIRQNIPEVIFCPGKTIEQIVAIASRLHQHGTPVLVTRADAAIARALHTVNTHTRYDEQSRTVVVGRVATRKTGQIIIVTAGTSDIPVAEEAKVTAEVFGSAVTTIYDVGVAGLHRLLDRLPEFTKARVFVVVAGMDGVLPSVIGGLVKQPIVAVPTSRGYGTGKDGVAALHTMLNSCAPGIGVMNIDNGFGAGCLAHKINQLGKKR
ncbi:MAG TPA: nickel pincer cofactor biosynthesis protein LarB [Nitrospirales bacterium]|nr:nickel pincer cofactor biosynthesis protein LarB [Nitrospirales bacterium]HIO70239.1 nickel pincer cofactor biosynthesis protein LarB [Nitrospirales bacterium]